MDQLNGARRALGPLVWLKNKAINASSAFALPRHPVAQPKKEHRMGGTNIPNLVEKVTSQILSLVQAVFFPMRVFKWMCIFK